MKRVQSAKQLKPTNDTIQHVKAVNSRGAISMFSIYIENNIFHVAKGLIFHVKQTHEIVLCSDNWKKIEKFINEKKK